MNFVVEKGGECVAYKRREKDQRNDGVVDVVIRF